MEKLVSTQSIKGKMVHTKGQIAHIQGNVAMHPQIEFQFGI